VHGEPMLTAYLRDITARRLAEAARLKSVELEADNRRVREANRLKSAFLANMSHELRTPLNSIIGFSSILHAGRIDPDDERHHEFLGYILTSGQHLLQVINDVLDLSKIEAGKLELHPEACELDRVIDEVLSVMQSTTMGQHFVTTVSVDPSIRQVVIDPARLKQVLYNYLSNAFKFTPEGGTVDVRATPDGPEMFLLEVADSGVGIAEADLGRLFQDFQQLDSGAAKPHGGTGLGLALTKRLVEAQGGSVGVRSTVGDGSVFHACLPRRHEITSVVAPRVADSARSAGPAVLVVDDDRADRAQIVDALEHAGYSVEAVATGAEAVRRCQARAFDAITLDLLLPDQSGLDVLTQIRSSARRPDAPVVVVTIVAEARMLAGHVVSDILPKPVEVGAILASLRRAGVPARSPNRILVVDDDESSAKLLAVSLEVLGYAVEFQTDARAGLASANASPPSAIVLDLLMPRVDGFQFIDELRVQSVNRTTPVIVWTVKDLSGDEAQRLGTSVQGVLQKSQDNMTSLIHDLQTVLAPLAAGRV
jgi:CheY-like chemotaxis protein/nitrogen-specific signal transduction histidine kinase